MPFSCIHTHTSFCDGADDIETNCRMAYDKGLESLGFSSHAPVTKKTGFRTHWHMPDERLEEYLDAVRAAKKRWEGKLPVYLGLEVDYISGIMGPGDKDYREMGLDYIIAAVHYVVAPRGEPFTVDDSAEAVERGINEGYGGDAALMTEAYFKAQTEIIRGGGFDLLAHPDLVKKNKAVLESRGLVLFREDDSFYREKTAAIAALLASAGIPAELNTGGLNRGKINECYPSLDFLKQLREQGVPMVINADAHKAEHLGGYYDTARQAMLAAGFSETAVFAGRQGGKAVWKSVKL